MDSKDNNGDISVIICTKDASSTIEMVLDFVKRNNPLEIIVVDANSNDGTREVAKKFEVNIITDPGKGLAYARNMGVEVAKGKYIFFAGADNIMPSGSISSMKDYLLEYNYVGVGALTRLENKNYLTKCSNKRWESLIKEGPREVIGTPYMFIGEILKKYKYDPKMTWSDDSDLGARLAKDGHKVGYSNTVCYEIGVETLKSMRARFKMYGRSDFEYYNKYSSTWDIRRKLKSVMHPMTIELINPMKRIKTVKEKLYYFPFFAYIMFFRYCGWIKNTIKGNDNSKQ
ncbi:MAG: glycosyltransferase family 2 protein [Acholeplasma sp.]|nr:glycosyltransferase family 2 protein [Acholeplasma sp.]